MMLAAAAAVAALLWLPNAFRLERVTPVVAALLWLTQLALRALLCVYAALFVASYVPGTEAYALVSAWCWHAVVPLLATHLQLTGHNLGDAATVGPLVLLGASLAWGGWGVVRAARTVRRMLANLAIGTGPGDSVILGDRQVVIAAAGLRRPQLVVSAGALVALDDDELAAGLDHERGHIARGHRFAMVAAEGLGAIARFLPGTRHAQAELLFHLERDADEFALNRQHHPASLASAICKAAESAFPVASPALSLGGGSVVRRLNMLLDAPRNERVATAMAATCALLFATITILGVVAMPAAAQAGLNAAGATVIAHVCPA